jgi:hypothetical protein
MSTNSVQEKDDTRLQSMDNARIPLVVHSPGGTLLPGPLAALVSTVTGATSLGVKAGTTITGWWITGAREATLTGLEVTRYAVEAILGTAGRDVSQRSHTELGKLEAESILERTVSKSFLQLHTPLTSHRSPLCIPPYPRSRFSLLQASSFPQPE